MSLRILSRTTPAVASWCHDHLVWECAAVTYDTEAKAAVGVCHTQVNPDRPWCTWHIPNGGPVCLEKP